ncbi:hypothetical protein BKA57DRAFT_262434 [Linnemannia elongata]|nr:hypothetical protein BKA57DRAFT_262434 [Linnemannia elongata]
MAQQSTPSLDSTLGPVDDEPPSSQLESFPPLYITRSNVMHSPSLTLEPVVSSDPPSINEQGSRRWWILSLSCLLLFGNYFGKERERETDRFFSSVFVLRCHFLLVVFWVMAGA